MSRTGTFSACGDFYDFRRLVCDLLVFFGAGGGLELSVGFGRVLPLLFAAMLGCFWGFVFCGCVMQMATWVSS